jgi:hypothetical protein
MRSKQQVACDGVKIAWHTDAFTDILQQQVATQFSMDGVVPKKTQTKDGMTIRLAKRELRTQTERTNIKELVGVFRGTRLSLKRAYKTA